MGPGISAPRVLLKVDPDYTPEAKDAGIEGTVLLAVVIGADGVVHDVSVVRGPGYGLEQKAIEALAKWHFQPGLKDGAPVNVRAQIEFNFRLY
jgi:TonB family protein